MGTGGIEIVDRDLDILRGLFDSRVATIHHLSRLYFDDKIEAARKRLQKLKAAGVIHERPRQQTEPSIHCLTKKAFEILDEKGILREYPNVGWAHLEKRARVSPMTLKHELCVMDVRAALTAAAKRSGFNVVEFSTWPKLFEFVATHPRAGDVVVKPDGFIRIQGPEENGVFEDMFFLEVDRSSEEQDRLVEKAAAYRDYYVRGGLASRFGQPRSQFKKYPFVVLMVFKTAERRNNTAEKLLIKHPEVRNQVWLSTLSETVENPLGEIWVKPADYFKTTQGTDFDIEKRRHIEGYRRQPEREELVENEIAKHTLLAQTSNNPGRV